MQRAMIVRPAAQADLIDAKQWYENQRRGLGRLLLADARMTFDAIRANAEAFRIVENDVRIALFLKFPYVVAFQSNSRRITLLAIYHSHRATLQWWHE